MIRLSVEAHICGFERPLHNTPCLLDARGAVVLQLTRLLLLRAHSC